MYHILGLPEPYASDLSTTHAMDLKIFFAPSPLTKALILQQVKWGDVWRLWCIRSTTYLDGLRLESRSWIAPAPPICYKKIREYPYKNIPYNTGYPKP